MDTVVYTVRKGNTLFGIAQFFGTTIGDILRFNNIQDPNQIYVGQTLVVPVDTAMPASTYVTRPGDTLWSIAQRFGTTVDQLMTLNNLGNPNIIYPGQIIRVS